MCKPLIHLLKSAFTLWIFVLICLSGINASGANESYTGSSGPHLRGVPFNDTFSVTDGKWSVIHGFTTSAWTFVDQKVTDRVSLDLNYLSTSYYGSPFTVTVSLQITSYYNPSNFADPTNILNTTLKISYDPRTGKKHIDENSFTFSGGYKFIVKILTISTTGGISSAILSDMVRIDGYIDDIRYYKPLLTATTFNAFTHPTPQELTVNWVPVAGAEGYDLEWLWIDNENYTPFTSKIQYKNNSTRVTIAPQANNAVPNSYTIPLFYEKGFLVFRIRSLWKAGSSYQYWQQGNWSMVDNANSLGTFGFSAGVNPSSNFIYPITASYQNGFNWQSSIAFAEQSKQKSTASFFDGSLRSRQTIAKNYTDNKTIIAEKIYDHVGRPAISVLPVPSDSLLTFHTNFNIDSTGNPYNWEDFEKTTSSSCTISAAAMSGNSGAAKYYKSNSTFVDYQRYVPISLGYPYAQTEYMPDNTNRERRQGGLGKFHQLESGHESKYYYGLPDQRELNKIFGSDVGYSSRYKKNMVVDPNGQISISYMDAHGRVIATALAGDGSVNTDAIDSNRLPTDTTKAQLLDPLASINNNQFKSVLDYHLMVEKSGNRKFVYKFTPEHYSDTCYNVPSGCFDCVYDLEIVITDDCNNIILDTTKIIGKLPADSICGNNLDSVNDVFSLNMSVGSYTVHKVLSVDQTALSYYTNQYVKHNKCLKTYNQFYTSELAKIDFSGCNAGCPTCNPYNGCTALYGSLLADMSPGGQYALYYTKQTDSSFKRDFTLKLSIFNTTGNKLPNDSADWRHPKTPYVDISGNQSYVYYKNIKYLPENLPDVNTFVDNWQPSWAKSLVSYHPEYQYYQWCLIARASGSDQFDSTILGIDSFRYAKRKGYFNALYNSANLDSGAEARLLSPGNHVTDPFFTSGHPANSYISYMRNRMQHYVISPTGKTYSIWQVAIISAKCPTINLEYPDTSHDSNIQDCLTSFDSSQASCTNNDVWRYFKMYYLAEKQRLKSILQDQYAIIHRGYNGCIGNSSFQFVTIDTLGNEHINECMSPSLKPNCQDGSGYSPENDKNQPCFLQNSALYAGKAKRFDANYKFAGIKQTGNNSQTGINHALNAVTDSIGSQCKVQCSAYIADWMYALQKCADLNPSFSPWNATNAYYRKIRDTLDSICVRGCDYQNPLGSSSVPPSDTRSTYPDFQSAIMGILGRSGFDTTCNAFLISMPKSYGHDWGIPSANASSCVTKGPTDHKCIYCDQLRAAWKGFDAAYPSAAATSWYGSMVTNYLNNQFNTNLSVLDFQNLLQRCNNDEPIPSNCTTNDSALYLQNFFNKIIATVGLAGDTTSYSLSNFGSDTNQLWFTHMFPSFSSGKPEIKLVTSLFGGGRYTWEIRDALGMQCDLSLTLPQSGYFLNHITNILAIRVDPNSTDGHSFLVDAQYNTGFLSDIPVYTVNITMLGTSSCWRVSGCTTVPPVTKLCSAQNLESGTSQSKNPWNAHTTDVHADYYKTAPISTCGCDAVFRLLDDYNANPSHYPGKTFDQVCSDKFGTTTGKGDKITDSCLYFVGQTRSGNTHAASANWGTSTAITRLNAAVDRGVSVPNSLSPLNCSTGDFNVGPGSNACLACSEIGSALADAKSQFDTMSKNDNYYNRLSQYLSMKFGKTLTAIPGTDTSSCSTCSRPGLSVCIAPNEQGVYLDTLLTQLSQHHMLNSATSLSGYPKFLVHMRPTDTTCTSFNYAGIVSGGGKILTGTITASCSTFTSVITLTYTGVGTITYSSVDSFEKISMVHGAGGGPNIFNITAYIGGVAYALTGHVTYYNIATCCDFSRFCETPVDRRLTLDTGACRRSLLLTANINAIEKYNRYLDSAKKSFQEKYTAKCMGKGESLVMKYIDYQYHYTLYYYDQGGNLVKTVPPKGVSPLGYGYDTAINRYRRQAYGSTRTVNSHTLTSLMKYNSLNENVWFISPDADSTVSWYDNLGRVVVSQSGRQRPLNKYSYNRYDGLGRIIEVGETQNSTVMTVAKGLDSAQLGTWIRGGTHRQITQTIYDTIAKKYISKVFGSSGQVNLRNRVSTIFYKENKTDSSWTHATHYTYDEHGNISTIVQDYPELTIFNSRYKRVDYNYDLISGKVNDETYQGGLADQWHHHYVYDADDRLTSVNTSVDSVLWDKDAQYSYYQHGPMARTKLGRLNVQGVDYAYTLQGWLKGVNSDFLNPIYDQGMDGDSAPTNTHRWVCRDAYGFSLGYFSQDYTASNASAFYGGVIYSGGSKSGLADTAYSKDLYNGNIRFMATAINKFMGGAGSPIGTAYRYDQLNRLKLVTAFNNMTMSTRVWGTTTGGMGKYRQALTYDPMGNILTQLRDGDGSGGHTQMDQLTYNYTSGTNRLDHVDDAIPANYYSDDIDNQLPNNYLYDGSGNLTHDVAEQIDTIKWNAYGKVTDIVRTAGSTKPGLHFEYGADGQRVMKIVKKTANAVDWVYTWYARDAQGKVLATYSRGAWMDKTDNTHFKDSLSLREVGMYGSSRLGMLKKDTVMVLRDFNGSLSNLTGNETVTHLNSVKTTKKDSAYYIRKAGWRRYELSNHLGNVLATVSDRRLPTQHPGLDSVLYYSADVMTAIDYYAFGAPMPGRKYNIDSSVGSTKDTCITCGQLKTALYSYRNSMTDSTKLKAHLDSSFAAFHQTAGNWLTSLRTCKLLKEYVTTGAGQAFFQMAQHSSSEYHFGRGDITAEAWVYLTDTTNEKTIFSTETFSFTVLSQSGMLFMVHGARPVLEMCDRVHYTDIISSTHLAINTWYHLVATRTGNSCSNWHMYINGSLVTTSQFTGFSYTGLTPNANLANGNIDTLGCVPYIGINQGASNKWPFIGYYKQIRLYNRVISSTEISASYNSGCGASPSSTSNLAMWCPLYEGTGYTAHDLSSFADFGTDWHGGGYHFAREKDTSCILSGYQPVICNRVYTANASSYRYGFNGKEKDNETYGEGDAYDYGARIYDPRLGRFLSTDPMEDNFTELSTYSYAANCPILLTDVDGEFPGFAWLFGGEAHPYGRRTIQRRFSYHQEYIDETNRGGKAPVNYTTTVGSIKGWGTTMNVFISQITMNQYVTSSTIIFSTIGNPGKNHSNKYTYPVPIGTGSPNNVYDYSIARKNYEQNSNRTGQALFPRISVSTSDILIVNINRGTGIFGNTDGCYDFTANFDVTINVEKTWYVHVFRPIYCPSRDDVKNDPKHEHRYIFIYSKSPDIPETYLKKWNKGTYEEYKDINGDLKGNYDHIETSNGMSYDDAEKWKKQHNPTGPKPK